jgi:hypothetical protein
MNVYRVLVGKPEGKKPLKRPRYRRREDNIKIHVGGMGWSDMDWIDRAQDRDQLRAAVNTVLHFRIPLTTRNLLINSVASSFSRRTVLHGVGPVL